MNIRLDSTITPFNLEHTLKCGQSFRWEKHGDWWYGIVREKIIKIRQIREGLQFQIFPRLENAGSVANHFRLDDDLPCILSEISNDEHIRRVTRNFRGLRITRQEPWECLISYMCATYKNIPAIKKMIFNLCEHLGKKMNFDSHVFYTFPKPETLAKASLEELKRCELGFRTRHILRTSRIIHEKQFDFEALKEMSYERAKRELLSLPGVGQKVADCVLLFSLDKLEAFPVDIWIKRAMLKFYTNCFEKSFVEKVSNRKSITIKEYGKISTFGREYFGEYAGYAQEYLFASSRKIIGSHVCIDNA